MMKIKYFKLSMVKGISPLLIGVLFLLVPFVATAQTIYYGAQGEVIGSSDSRMAVTIIETENHVTLQVMAIGEILADGYGFELVYQPDALVLTDHTFARDIPIGLNPSDLGSPVIQLDSTFVVSNPTFSTQVMNHKIIPAGPAAGMRSLNTAIGTSNTSSSRVIRVPAGKMIPVYSIFFRKKVVGEALKTSDIGYHNNQNIPRSFSSWSYRGVFVTFAQGGASEKYYHNQELFTYRSPSSVITLLPATIGSDTVDLKGNITRGKFSPASDIVVSGRNSAIQTGKLDFDSVIYRGFIYSKEDVDMTVKGISDQLNINDTDYDFPSTTEIAAGTFNRAGKTFYIVWNENTVSDRTSDYVETITNLEDSTQYYAWSVMQYAFQTSDPYILVGDKIEFTTKAACEQPAQPIAISEQVFCENALVSDLIAFVEPNSSLLWYNSLNILLDPSTPLVDGQTYYARAVEDGCESNATAVTVRLESGLSAPFASSPQLFCEGSQVSDLLAIGTAIRWYDAPVNGNLLAENEILVDGRIYYAAQHSAICESQNRTAVKVIITDEYEIPAPNIASPQTLCHNATLADIGTDGSNIAWYDEIGTALPPNTFVVNGTTYYAATRAGTCESTERTAVLIYISDNINAPVITSPQVFCEGAMLSNVVVPNNQIIWYATPTGNTPLSHATLLAPVTYYAAQRAGVCESTIRTPVQILFGIPEGPVAPSPQSFCGENITLADLYITGSGITWYDAPVNGNILPSSTALTTMPTTYYAVNRTGDCESKRTAVEAHYNIPPGSPVVTDDIYACEDALTFDLTQVVTEEPNLNYIYYSDMGITEITHPESLPLPAQYTVYYVKALNPLTGCTSGLTPINVYLSTPPVVGVIPAGAYTTVGSSVTVIITDNNTNMDPGAKTILVSDPAIVDAVLVNHELRVTGKRVGNTEIVYTSVNEHGCETVVIIPAQVGGLPTGIITGKDIVKCNVPGGGDTELVQLSYIMGGEAPWTVTISDDRGTFSIDTVITSLELLPVNIAVEIPENLSRVPQYTTYTISNIVDATGASKQTHYGAVRIGTNPTPQIFTVANKEQIVCAGETTLPVSFDGVATLYRWSVDRNIGLTNYSSDVIPPFTAVNESSQPVTAHIVITPEYWYNGVVCIGNTDTATVTVYPTLTADFSVHVSGPGRIQFMDESSDNAISWSWNFGDGSPESHVQNPEHTYGLSGTYLVTLKVTSADGCEVVVSRPIAISTATDLEARFSINENIQCLAENEFIFRDLSRITTSGYAISSWYWDFDDGTTATTQHPTHTYTQPGTYNVTLWVTETPGGTQSNITQTVKVLDKPVITDKPVNEVCEGDYLQVMIPDIIWNGNAPVEGTWLLEGFVFNPVTQPIRISDNGKLLQYSLNTLCGVSISDGEYITVNAKPVMGNISNVIYCADEKVPAQSLGDEPGITYYWVQSGDNIGLPVSSGTDSIPAFTTVNNTSNPLTAVIDVTPVSGTCQGNTVRFNITVYPKLVMTSARDMGQMCSNTNFNYTATSNLPNTGFTWFRPGVGGINNGNENNGTGANITELLQNSTDSTIKVKYIIELTDGNCNTRDTVIIRVNPAPEITIDAAVYACQEESEAVLHLTTGFIPGEAELRYSIEFSESALLAGFVNVNNILLSGDQIGISLPENLIVQNYSATLRINMTGVCENTYVYPFVIHINGKALIDGQPQSVEICNSDGFTLSVSARGNNLTYQWYRDGDIITGATSATYSVTESDENSYGNYYVIITNECGTVTSETAEVTKSDLHLLTKWNDVIFISNNPEQFTAYQWYKNGRPVSVNGNYQSYVENGGLDGTYSVLVTYADGSQAMSCPYTVQSSGNRNREVTVYPNPASKDQEFIVDVSRFIEADEVGNTRLEIFDMTGRSVLRLTMESVKQKVRISTWGTYMVRVTTAQGEMVTKKVIIAN